MKKYFILLVMAAAMAMPSHAQVSFGLKGGLNLTEMSLNRSELESAISNKSGFFVGPTVRFTVPVVGLSFDASALYDQREAKVKGTDETLKQQSIQVPINIRYGIGLGDLANVFLFAGPQFGFNVGDKEKVWEAAKTEWTLKSSNLSGNVGLGLTLANHLQVTVNYNIAFGTTGEFTVVDAGKEVVSKNKTHAWQIAAAYYF